LPSLVAALVVWAGLSDFSPQPVSKTATAAVINRAVFMEAM
jgi:hypothetical protein